jgi:hypothetical protein
MMKLPHVKLDIPWLELAKDPKLKKLVACLVPKGSKFMWEG